MGVPEKIVSFWTESRASKLLRTKGIMTHYSSYALARDPVSLQTAEYYRDPHQFVEDVRQDTNLLAWLALHDKSALVRKSALKGLLSLADSQITRANIAISLERTGIWADSSSAAEVRKILQAGMSDMDSAQIFARYRKKDWVPTFHAGLIIQASALKSLWDQCQQGLGITKEQKQQILAFIEKSGLRDGYKLTDLRLIISKQPKPPVLEIAQTMGVASSTYRLGDAALAPSIDEIMAGTSRRGKSSKIEPVEVGDLPGFKQVVDLACQIKTILSQ